MVWLNTDSASTYLGEQASTLLSKKLGTRVVVEKVNMGFLNRIDLVNIKINDQKQKTLLKAQTLSARIQLSSLLKDQIEIKHVGLYDAQIHLYKPTAKAKSNFQFIIDSLSSKDDTGKALAIKANSIVCNHLQLSYDVWDEPQTPSLLNANHIRITNLTGSFALNHTPEKNTQVRVRNILLKEACGLEIKHARGIANIADKEITLEKALLELPHSMLSVPHATWQNKQQMLTDLALDATLVPADLQYIYAPLASIQEPLHIKLSAKEFNKHIQAQTSLQDMKEDLKIDIQALVNPNIFKEKQVHVIGHVQECYANEKWLTKIPQLLQNKDIDELMTSIGYVRHQGDFSIQGKNITWQGTTQSNYGKWDENIRLNNQRIQGNIEFAELNSGALLPAENGIKNCNGNISVEGLIKPLKLNVNTRLKQLEWNNYTYQNLQLQGAVQDKQIQAELQTNDPKIQTSIQANIQYGTNLKIETEGNISKLEPAALHLTNQFGNCELSSNFRASYETKQNDQHAQLSIENFNIKDSTQSFECKKLNVALNQNSNQSNLAIQSDMLDASVIGNLPLNNMANTLLTYIEHTLPSMKNWVKHTPMPAKDIDFNIQLKNSHFLQYFLNIPLEISEPINLSGYLDSKQNKLKVSTWLPNFTYKESEYAQGSVFLTGNTDSLKLLAKITKTFNKDQVHVEMNMPIKQNTIYPVIEWKTVHSNGTQGVLNTQCQFFAEAEKKNDAVISIRPSYFTIEDSLWNISSSKIMLRNKNIRISPLEIAQGNKYISIHNQDTPGAPFKVTLHGLNVSHLQDLLNFHSVEFKGELYGTVSIPTHIDNNLFIPAQLQVRNFLFQDGHMGTLDVNASWQNDIQKVNIQAKAHETAHDSLLINGYVDVAGDNLELNFTPVHTNLEFLNSWLVNVIGEAQGSISGQLQLKGPLSGLDFTGSAVVDTMTFTPPVTNVQYALSNCMVQMEHGKFILNDWNIRDGKHGSCMIDGVVTHRKLGRFGYDMHFDANNFHAYNWDAANRETFWGNITADGNGRLYGDTRHVYANLELTPKRGIFYYNNSSQDNTDAGEFIRFHGGKIVASNENNTATNAQDNDMKDNSSDIYMDMTVNANPDVQLVILTDRKTGDGLYLHGSGPINMNWHNKGKFTINGLYLTTSGEYHLTIQDLMKRNFQIQPNGYLRFSGSAEEGDINMKGIHTVRSVSLSDLNIGQNISNTTTNVNCELNFNGRTNNPQVTFGLDFPTAGDEMRQTLHNAISSQEDMNMQMLYLLTIGRFYTYDFNTSGNTTTQNQSVLAMQSLAANTLGNSLSSIINQALHITNWTFAPNFATGKMGWNDMEVGGQIQGSLLQNRLKLSGNFGYREQTTYSNNFVGDFNIKYLLNKKGTISLKAYSETNDRYFSRSSLSTQGGGIMFQHNFNKIKDIFQKKKTLNTK